MDSHAQPVPPTEDTCAGMLARMVEENPGIAAVTVDHRRATLTLNYDPARISPRAADRIALDISHRINRREASCAETVSVRCVDCVALTPHDEAHRHVAVITNGDEEPPIHLTETALAKIEKRYRQVGRLEKEAAEEGWLRRNLDAVLTAVSLLTLLAGVTGGALGLPHPAQIALFVLSYMAGGYSGLVEGLRSLREWSFDVNLLMLAAAIGAAAIGDWAEGAILLFLFSLSGTLEGYAMDRTRAAIESLMDLSPDEALVKVGEAEIRRPVEELAVGDVIIVKPGERIAADGEVLAGQSEVDQSPITGESIPVAKEPGDPVFAGSINGQGAMEVRVTRLAQESTLAKIIQLVSEAQSQRSPTQRAIDWFGSRYTVGVILGTLGMIFIP
ncbi:MAG: heavy metal translocating P-type ATPase, partial [Caldilineae bacterium]